MDAGRRTLWRLLGVVLAALALVAPLGAVRAVAASEPADVPLDPGADHAVVDGVMRTYVVRRPLYAPRLPMLVVLHGAGATGADMERDTGFTDAIGGSALVVYPDGLHGTWNAGGCCLRSAAEDVDDVGFVTALVQGAIAQGFVDPERVYVAGFSNGGMLAYRLLCDAPVRLAGVAIVAGALVSPCPAPPVDTRVLVVHSASDVMVPPRGYDGVLDTGQALHYPSLLETVGNVRQSLGCPFRASISAPSVAGLSTVRWLACRGGGELDVDVLADFGHTWPGNRREPDASSQPLDATYATLATFAL